MPFESLNPATGEVFRTWSGHDRDEVERRLTAAVRAQADWKTRSYNQRAVPLKRAADLLRERADDLGALMAQEMGKVLPEAVGEARKCGWVCDHYADNAADYLARESIPTDGSGSWVQYDPVGLVLAIMPWNFPLWQAFRFGAPALMAGNGVLLKHAPTVQGCAEAIVEICLEAGIPQGLITNLRIETDAVAELIEDRRVAAVTLTGSTRAGAAVASVAGAALKKSVLELGGSDPFVVLSDADLDEAARVGAASRLLNAGQSCVAAKRFIVVADVAEAFVAKLRDRFVSMRMGEDYGPLAREDLRETLHRQVSESIAAGAVCELGGRIPDRAGWFYPATLLTEVGPGMPAWDGELFGPVAAVRVVDDAERAFEVANDTIYGLGASIWTADTSNASELARRVDAGCVFLNGMVKSDPRLPFGGIKQSGWGRELGAHGIREFVNARTVWVR